MTEHEPVGQPKDISDPAPEEGEHLQSPDEGYPAEDVEPAGGGIERAHEHPEDIADTTPERDTTP